MKKIVRIKDDYGVKQEIEINENFNIQKGDEVYVEYKVLDVISVMHDIEEETVYHNCVVKERSKYEQFY